MVDLTQYFLERAKKSRHNIYEHIMMIEILRECFENKDPIRTASQKAGISDSTARRYYAKWKAKRRKGIDWEYYFEHRRLIKRGLARLFKSQRVLSKQVEGVAKSLDSITSELQSTHES